MLFLSAYILFMYVCMYVWLCWVFVSARGLSLAVASGGHSSSRCAGLSPSRPLPLWSTGSRRAGSVVVAHGPSRSAARGILPDQGSNPCALHWQADSQPLRHQGSPISSFKSFIKCFDYHTGISVCMESLFGCLGGAEVQFLLFLWGYQLYQNHLSPSVLFRTIFVLNQVSTYPWPLSRLITGASSWHLAEQILSRFSCLSTMCWLFLPFEFPYPF